MQASITRRRRPARARRARARSRAGRCCGSGSHRPSSFRRADRRDRGRRIGRGGPRARRCRRRPRARRPRADSRPPARLAATSSATGSGARSWTVVSKPAGARCAATGLPMLPSPMNPARIMLPPLIGRSGPARTIGSRRARARERVDPSTRRRANGRSSRSGSAWIDARIRVLWTGPIHEDAADP